MARRASKAANRRARQQRRANQQRTAPAQPSAAATDAAVAEPAVVEAEVPKPATPAEAPRRARSTGPTGMALTGSTLTATERSEYHYVERDLRNIGILSLVMVGLLILAWFLFTATGLIG